MLNMDRQILGGFPNTLSKSAFVQTTISGFLPSPPAETEAEIHTISDLLNERLQNIPNDPLIGYPTTESGCDDYRYFTITELDQFANKSAQNLLSQGLLVPNYHDIKSEENKVVAILGPSNLDYIVSIFALSRIGYAVLFLSTRLATEAYVSLLEKTGCQNIVCHQRMEKTVASISAERPMNVFKIATEEIYRNDTSVESLPLPGSSPAASKRCAFIVHSSGSTGLPKPIFQTHSACISNYASSKGYRAFLTLPLYHNHGISTTFRAIFKGKPIAMHNANLPLTGDNLLRAMRSVRPESFHGVPYALKLLSETAGGAEELARCEQVLFGGSSCPDDLGDLLVGKGVKLVSHYGATEMGQLMTSYRPAEDLAWNYLRPLPSVQPYLWMAPQEDGSFECVVLDGLPAKVTSNCNKPPNSFRTSDTFLPHPIIPNAWKYLGRIDDRITLLNGEKVLPIPIEHRIRQNGLVKDVVVFGVGQTVPGLMIFPSLECHRMTKEEIMQQVWSDIEKANTEAEAFSQISSEMVVIMDVEEDYPATDKGTLIRAATYRKYAEVIEAVYANAEIGDDDTEKLSLDVDGLISFLLEVFQAFDINDETDFFGAGIDSLQSIKARGTILRNINIGTATLGHNVVYDYPTVRKLAVHLYSLRTGEEMQGEDEVDAMADLISKHSSFKTLTQEQSMLITGATGTLGAHLLSQLLQQEHVKRVYCLVRASTHSDALDRVLSTLTRKGMQLNGASKICAFSADLSQPSLGLEEAIVQEIRSNLTTVIHSAWAVNFKLGVRSFEQQHIRGVQNLINLCLSAPRAPARFFFCSSISAAAGTPLPATIAEAPVPELSHAQSMGYARSKLVAEKIVEAAANRTGMVAKVLRIGQIVGDCESGFWNTTEAIPLMIQSAISLKALPALDETPSWLPVDVVARTIIELCNRSHHDADVVYNVQNPRLFHWTKDLLPALQKAGLDFDVVGQREWVQKLRNSEQDPKKNPTVKLLDFYAEKYDNERMGRKGLYFLTDKTEEQSQTLRGGFDIVGSGLVDKFVRQWRQVW